MEVPVTAKVALLLTLLQKPGFGKELAERVKSNTAGGVWLTQGSIYPGLRNLAEAGLVEPYGICACGCEEETPMAPAPSFAPVNDTKLPCRFCKVEAGQQHTAACRRTAEAWNENPGEYLVPLHYLPDHSDRVSALAKEGRPRVYYRLTQAGRTRALEIQQTLRKLADMADVPHGTSAA